MKNFPTPTKFFYMTLLKFTLVSKNAIKNFCLGRGGAALRINSSECVCMYGVWVSVTVYVNVRDSGRVLVSVNVWVSVNAWF